MVNTDVIKRLIFFCGCNFTKRAYNKQNIWSSLPGSIYIYDVIVVRFLCSTIFILWLTHNLILRIPCIIYRRWECIRVITESNSHFCSTIFIIDSLISILISWSNCYSIDNIDISISCTRIIILSSITRSPYIYRTLSIPSLKICKDHYNIITTFEHGYHNIKHLKHLWVLTCLQLKAKELHQHHISKYNYMLL